jgi:hypothetical protein
MDMVAVILLTLSLSTGAKDDPDHRTWTVDVLHRDITYPTMDRCLSMLDGDIDRIGSLLTTVGPRMRLDHTTNTVALDNIIGRGSFASLLLQAVNARGHLP